MLRVKDLFSPFRGVENGALLCSALIYNAYIIYYLWRLLTAY